MKKTKIIKLIAYSLIDCIGHFHCNKCNIKSFKIIFHDTENDVWYCSSCLIKELNKTEIVKNRKEILKEYI